MLKEGTLLPVLLLGGILHRLKLSGVAVIAVDLMLALDMLLKILKKVCNVAFLVVNYLKCYRCCKVTT